MTINIANRKYLVQWRAFIGPKWTRDDDPTFWNWPALTLAAYTPAPSATECAVDLEPGATSLVLVDPLGWPSAGGCWVGPKAAGEAWEYIGFTGKSVSTLTGLVRETVDAEQTGHHASGAAVRFWWPLANDSGETEFTEELDDNIAAVNWGSKLAGFSFPQGAIRNRHLILIQCRWADGTNPVGAWQNELIGWLLSPQAKDDLTHDRPWQADIASSATMASFIEIAGLRVGANNSALQGSATGSVELAATYKEAGSGEFTAGEPLVAPTSAIDADMTTLYISERHTGAANEGTGWGIDQVHPAPYVGQGSGYKWAQLDVDKDSLTPGTLTWFWLLNQAGYGPAYLSWPDNQSINAVPDSGIVLIVENEQRFREENPDTGDALIICPTKVLKVVSAGDVTGIVVLDAEYTIAQWWASLTAAGGGLKLLVKQGAVVSDPGPSEVIWGNVTQAACAAAWSGGSNWSGAVLPALAAGQTIRRLWVNGGLAATGYSVGRPSMPGYFLRGMQDYLWLAVERKPMGLRLKNDITATNPPTPTDELAITSDLGDTVDGLPAAGTIQIGAEQISYTAKSADNEKLTGITRGANSTTAATHSAGDTVYVLDSGVATDALPLLTINVKRRAGRPAPKLFNLYASRLALPQPPDEDNPDWVDDWTLLVTVATNTADTYTYTLPASARYRHVLLQVYGMETDPYRLMVNEIELIDDPTVYANTRNLPDNSTAAAAMDALLDLAGLPSGAITDAGDTPPVWNYTTDTGMAWQVVADVASFTGCRVTCGRDSKITLALESFWDGTALTAEHTWDNSVISSIEPQFQHGYGVGQIKLKWQSADAGTRGYAYYPADCDDLGAVVEVGPFYCADQAAADAKAERLYWLRRLPYQCPVEAAGPGWEVHAGDVAQNTWQLDDTMLPLLRTYLVKSVHMQLSGMAVNVLPVLAQVERESEY